MEQMGMQVDPLKDRGRLIDELLSTYVEPGPDTANFPDRLPH